VSAGDVYAHEGGRLKVDIVRKFLRHKAPGVEVLTLTSIMCTSQIGCASTYAIPYALTCTECALQKQGAVNRSAFFASGVSSLRTHIARRVI
jgi:hypothetical protein